MAQCTIDYKLGFDNAVPLMQDGNPMLNLYGLEQLPLSRLEVVEGESNKDILVEKLKTGQYIIEGLRTDDYEKVIPDSSHFAIGDIVTINVDGRSYSYELLAKAKQRFYSNTNRVRNEFGFYLLADEYLGIVTRPVLMTYAFNAADGREDEMEQFIKGYIAKVEPLMNYESKGTMLNEFAKMRNMIIIVGGILSFTIGLVGLLNFMNVILTGIIARHQEFAVIQSIGMTGRQLHRLLIYEGLYYASATLAVSLLGGALLSFLIIRGIAGNLWFFSYQFAMAPILWFCPILVALSILIPFADYRGMNRQSIVERLRAAE